MYGMPIAIIVAVSYKSINGQAKLAGTTGDQHFC